MLCLSVVPVLTPSKEVSPQLPPSPKPFLNTHKLKGVLIHSAGDLEAKPGERPHLIHWRNEVIIFCHYLPGFHKEDYGNKQLGVCVWQLRFMTARLS